MRRKIAVAAACIGAAALIAGGGVLLRARHYQAYDLVYPGVVCDGTDLSGMTYGEAKAAIDAMVADKQFAVTLSFPEGETWEIQPAQTVEEAAPGTALASAWNYGRADGSMFGPWRAFRAALGADHEIPMDYRLRYDREDVARQVGEAREALTLAPTDSAGTVDDLDHTVRITLGEKGRTFDGETVTDRVCEALDRQEDEVSLTFDPIPLDREQLGGLLEDLADRGYVPVTEPEAEYDEARETTLLHVGTPGYTLNVEAAEAEALAASDRGEDKVTVALEETLPKDYDLEGLYTWLKRDPQENYYYVNGALVGGEPGYDFDLETAEADLGAAVYGDTVEIPLTVTQPRITREWAEWGLFRSNFGSSDTYHTGDAARTTNLRLACAALDGTIINPGEEFSFNATVGERTAAKGYQYGIIYSNQGNESQIGGGICQVATGCYQAALLAGMEITERHEHMYSVSYCPGGLDATVYWGSLDVKFRNNWTMPVRLNASVSGGQVHVSLDGTNFWGCYVKLSSEYLGGLSYRAYRTFYRKDGSVYYREDLGVSSYSSH